MTFKTSPLDVPAGFEKLVSIIRPYRWMRFGNSIVALLDKAKEVRLIFRHADGGGDKMFRIFDDGSFKLVIGGSLLRYDSRQYNYLHDGMLVDDFDVCGGLLVAVQAVY